MPRLTFIVRSAAQVRLAVKTAAERSAPIYLRSTDEAGIAFGAPWFRNMVAVAADACPDVDAIAVLDCGPHAGAALAAFRHGVKHVQVNVAPSVRVKLAAIAVQYGADLIDDRELQPLVDLDLASNAPLSHRLP